MFGLSDNVQISLALAYTLITELQIEFQTFIYHTLSGSLTLKTKFYFAFKNMGDLPCVPLKWNRLKRVTKSSTEMPLCLLYCITVSKQGDGYVLCSPHAFYKIREAYSFLFTGANVASVYWFCPCFWINV